MTGIVAQLSRDAEINTCFQLFAMLGSVQVSRIVNTDGSGARSRIGWGTRGGPARIAFAPGLLR